MTIANQSSSVAQPIGELEKKKTSITVAHGDGIGPEIMEATLSVLEAAGAALDIETIEIGEQIGRAHV